MIPIDWILESSVRIAPYIQETPPSVDSKLDFYLKWENHQVTGSFKARGTFNKVLVMEDWEREAGLIATSTGNHGQDVALADQTFGISVKIYASDGVVPAKIKTLRALGAQVILIPEGYDEVESSATWISPCERPKSKELELPVSPWAIPTPPALSVRTAPAPP